MHELLKLDSQGGEPLHIADILPWLRLDDGQENEELLTSLCLTAREMAEKYCNRIFRGAAAFQETFVSEQPARSHVRAPGHPDVLTLSRGPLVQVQSISIDGIALSLALYVVSGGENVLPRVKLLQPARRSRLVVTYTAGTGLNTEQPAVANKPPEMALSAMKCIAAHLYANPESQDMPGFALRMLDLVGKLEA